MVTPMFDISQSRRLSAERSARGDGECLRYRLDVVAASAVDVVHSAGGWLYDRVMAGWQVTVLLPGGCDTRPLRILGVAVVDTEPDNVATAMGSTSHTLAVSAEAFTADARVRDKVLTSLDDRLTEVALWGEGWPLGVNRGMTRAQHVLSAAARKFKGYALAAAGIPSALVEPTEALLCEASYSRVDSELVRLD
ncbi:MAG: hypothetical protein VYA67_06100 [Actinomycetota bacterium]|uniref:Uncharacterized protein n=1 Tax=Mycobacterium lentiflavum TaxID=141349 RepID=A0ABY3UVZ3_MYCLN|nr:hypothetical protein [Mycobacterium lentiflavum]MEE3063524.1 hypothetical protein [Actinomycetota bacterium]ULP42783.1 hypothetical protein MJO58_01820 [Mycobacterium lentiflavum]